MTIRAVCCGLAAHASIRLDEETVAGMRRQPGSLRGETLPPNLLRHSDEQTIASLAAVIAAVESARLADDFTDWGVVAASRFAGRPAIAQAVVPLRHRGAVGRLAAPHPAPLAPLAVRHAQPGAEAARPELGAGGGPGAETEGLLAAVGLLHASRAPGIWLVISRMVPEGYCDSSTGRATAPSCTRWPWP